MVYDKEDAYLAIERMGIKYLLTENGYIKKMRFISLVFHLLKNIYRDTSKSQFIIFVFYFFY